jgi:hypothetical protein
MRTTSCLFILGTVLSLFTAAAQADDWRALNQTHFPSQVRVLQFKHPINATDCGLWGTWNVCFGSKQPVATYVRTPIESCTIVNITIDGLLCWNKVAGQKDCKLNMTKVPSGCWIGTPGVEEKCSIVSEGANAISFDVNCPAAISLQ